ncbi:MAG: AraC family transcriptional regulator ligand-binding domain-containing protein [Halopseudomonas sp.]|uniref:AraC family transcriptional regulator n=1 Tax=Halopseudomonas sp. TaxID=2901191 RepID=UPI003001CEA8
MPSDQHSVTPLYTQALLQSAERHGIALPAHLRELLHSRERIPLALQDELWESYCSLRQEPLAGLQLGLDIQVGHLDSAGMLLVTCDTLGEALEQLVEYAPVIGAGGDFSLQQQGALAWIEYQSQLPVRQAERVEAVLASQLNLTAWSTGGRFKPHSVSFAHAPLAELARYRELVDCELQFNAGHNRLSFSVDQLSLPLIQANSALREHLRQLADQTLASLGQHSLSAEVQRAVRLQPRWGKERIAEQLGISGRHLNRKLAEEGLSFKALRETVLQEMACQALQGRQSVAQIAEQLGFSDENAFVRAFRRWQGTTPARYRQG